MKQRIKQRLIRLADRAAMTAAQGAILAVGAETAAANALTFDWTAIGGYAAGGAFLSVVFNIGREGLTGRMSGEVDRLRLRDLDQ